MAGRPAPTTMPTTKEINTMARIEPVTSDNLDPKASKLLDGVEKSLGSVPNLFKTFAHSPATLSFYLNGSSALSGTSLSGAVREQIAVAVAGTNSCGYCASAHTALGKGAGVSEDELSRNLEGEASDPKVAAALTFARAVVEKRGWVSDDDVRAVRDAGYTERELTEIIAVVAINIFTNYFNHIAQTEIDFPKIEVPEPALS